jgi:hypothetical protein
LAAILIQEGGNLKCVHPLCREVNKQGGVTNVFKLSKTVLKSRNLLQKLHYSSVLAASGVCFVSFCGVDVGGVMLSSVKVWGCVAWGVCLCW